MAAGFAPGDFWEQSPATFNAAMRGAVKARKIALEHGAACAWWGSYFDREKRLGSLGKYLAKMRSGGPNRSAEIASAFKAMEKRGLDVRVRRIPKG